MAGITIVGSITIADVSIGLAAAKMLHMQKQPEQDKEIRINTIHKVICMNN